MKRKYFFLFTLLTLIFSGTGHALDKVASIDTVLIDIWPDYDQASVLVLLTGTLPDDTKLPASVTLPYPENAELNAIARIDTLDGKMKDDVLSTPSPGEFTFITPDLRFRLEYYVPYEVINGQHVFEFTWLADYPVNKLHLRAQQPVSATSFTTDPAVINVSRGEDGLMYYALPPQGVPAGQSLSIGVKYTMTTSRLSAASVAPPDTTVQSPGSPPSTSNTKTGMNWPLVAIGVVFFILVIAFVWQIAIRRAGVNQYTTQSEEAEKPSSSKFCQNCRSSIGKGDKFCQKCGASLAG